MPDCLSCNLYLCNSYEPVAHLQLREKAETKRVKGEASQEAQGEERGGSRGEGGAGNLAIKQHCARGHAGCGVNNNDHVYVEPAATPGILLAPCL